MNIFRKRTHPSAIELTSLEMESEPVVELSSRLNIKPVDYEFAPNDPFLHYLVASTSVVVIEKLDLDSPALEFLRNVGVKVVVPLVSQGELIGLLNLGPRLSDQDYSSDDFRLLNTLATQAAPALRVAQLARQQQAEARERERIEQELRVARSIQQTLLPKELPKLENWELEALWQPAREVSGDFYDFIEFPDGKLGIVIADVTDKGVPAALVMATTRTILREAAVRLGEPGKVLERTNELLCPDIPRNMFVTCLYVVLDPANGEMVYANAGHNLPQKCMIDGSVELKATGMPLGLMPGMNYEEKQAFLEPGESILMYSDGLVEAHNPSGEMFGFPRLRKLVGGSEACSSMIGNLLSELEVFTGSDWEQEDDITFVAVRRLHPRSNHNSGQIDMQLVEEINIPSVPGNERKAMEQIAEIVLNHGFPIDRIEKLKTAVAEATLNAIEHGNGFDPNKNAIIQIFKSEKRWMIRVMDLGGGVDIPHLVTPDIDAKIAGLQSPRGWGFFLIQSMVDEMKIMTEDQYHVIELIFNLISE